MKTTLTNLTLWNESADPMNGELEIKERVEGTELFYTMEDTKTCHKFAVQLLIDCMEIKSRFFHLFPDDTHEWHTTSNCSIHNTILKNLFNSIEIEGSRLININPKLL